MGRYAGAITDLLKARFPEADAWQIPATGTKDYRSPDGARIATAMRLLRTLVQSVC